MNTKILNRIFLGGALLMVLSCAKEKQQTSDALPAETAVSDVVTKTDSDQVEKITELKEIPPVTVDLEKAKELAISIMQMAADKSSSPYSDAFKTMITALQAVSFHVPPEGQDLKQCRIEKNVLAFVMSHQRKTIHLCSRALRKPSSQQKLAQILIHETAHVVGVDSECQATKLEVAAMRATSKGLSFENGYMKKCGIK